MRGALTALGGVDPDRNVGITDYLLGQADPIGRADAVRAPARRPHTTIGWRPCSSRRSPEVPGRRPAAPSGEPAPAGRPKRAAAGDRRPRRRTLSSPGQTRMIAVFGLGARRPDRGRPRGRRRVQRRRRLRTPAASSNFGGLDDAPPTSASAAGEHSTLPLLSSAAATPRHRHLRARNRRPGLRRLHGRGAGPGAERQDLCDLAPAEREEGYPLSPFAENRGHLQDRFSIPSAVLADHRPGAVRRRVDRARR